MSGFADRWSPGFDPATGILVLPSTVVIAALFVVLCVLVLRRAGRGRLLSPLSRGGLLLVGAAVVWVVLEATSAGTFAVQRRALDARLIEMTTRAVMPGSALACLDATAGELVEASCEKALFASPQATAASVAYVAAQLSLLADGREYERRSGANYEPVLSGLRHAIETDRFGIVAHVLAERDGCTSDRCGPFGLLRDASRVSDNLTGHRYDATVMHHATEWLQSELSLMAANSIPVSPTTLPAPAPQNSAAAAAGKAAPNGLYFPSSSSIPPVSIMNAEPTGAAAPADASGKAPAARKPAAPAQQARRPTNLAAPGRPAPAPEQAGDP